MGLAPLRRRAGGHGLLALVAVALLTLLAVQPLASALGRHDPDKHIPWTVADGEQDDCEGALWNTYCPTCRSSADTLVPLGDSTPYRPASGQMPIVSHTIKLIRPLLTLAAEAWCLRLHRKPWSSSSSSPPAPSCAATSDWPGFSSTQLRYVFSFGDSFTSTWFNWRDNPPSSETPLGNPPYPGFTSASGANWIDLLTIKYNQTYLQTYNLAIGGAAVDQDIQLGPPLFGLDPFEPDQRSLKDQVQRDFMTGYAYKNAPAAPAWNSGNTLFTIWIGINDVVGSYLRGPDGPEGTRGLNDRIFATYTRLVEVLYDQGARNFIFLNVPAVDRSPVIVQRGPHDMAWLSADLDDFNGRLVNMAREVKTKHQGVNVWIYDTRADFGKVLDNPHAFPQTSGLKNVTDSCDKYGTIW